MIRFCIQDDLGWGREYLEALEGGGDDAIFHIIENFQRPEVRKLCCMVNLEIE